MRRSAILAVTAAALAGCTLLLPPDDLSAGGADGGGNVDGEAGGGGADVVDPGSDGAPTGDDGSVPSDARPGVDGGPDGAPTYAATVLADAPLAYWRLGEASGTSAADRSGNNHTGPYVSGVTLGTAGAIANDTDKAATFNGNNFVRVADVFDFAGTVPFTIECWVKPSVNDGSYRGIVTKERDNDAGRQGWLLWLQSVDGLGFERFRDSTSNGLAIPITDALWHHVAMTYDGAVIRDYMDGVLKTTRNSTIAMIDSPSVLVIGIRYEGVQGGGFIGAIDEVAIYGAALSATRVAAHYQVGAGK